jgi:hypothetical protein
MRRAVAIFAIFAVNGLSPTLADPPATPATPAAPEAPSTTAPTSTAGDNTGQKSAAQKVSATATAANSAPSASDEQREEKLLQAEGYRPTLVNGEKVFCRREIPTGSHLASTLKCLTVEQAKAMTKDGRETTEHLQRNMAGCLSSGSKGVNCGN